MAIYHLNAQIIKRGDGHSSVAAMAYRCGLVAIDERTGIKHDYSRKAGIDGFENLAPVGSPDWMLDPCQLWNQIEAVERRQKAQLCREVNIALPRELTPDQMKELIRDFVSVEMVGAKNVGATVAFHHLQSSNPHAHIMLTMRPVVGAKFGNKEQEFKNGQSRDWLLEVREQWANYANAALADAMQPVMIDHRTLIAQGIDRTPSKHIGVRAWAMHKRGITMLDRLAGVMKKWPTLWERRQRKQKKLEQEHQQTYRP